LGWSKVKMRLVSALIAVASCVTAIGCGLNQEGIGPPNNTIFFPGAILVGADRLDPTDSRWLFVVNSNSDLRYNDGTLVAVDLEKVKSDRDTKMWGNCPSANYIYPSSSPPGYCCWDLLDSNVLNCDERDYVKSAVRLGSFGSAIEAQPSSPAGGNKSRLFVGVRGNASITYADVDATSAVAAPVFTCVNGNPGSFDECDTAHRVINEPNPDTANPVPVLPDEPYALAIDPTDPQPLLYVGHLRAGFLSALDLRVTPPTLIGSFGSIFPTDVNGSAGVTSITVTAAHANVGRAYATSRFLPRAGAFGPFSTTDPSDTAVADSPPSPGFFLGNAGDVFVSPLIGSEVRGIQIIPGINRTYLLQRTPPALVGFDTLGGQNVPSDVMEICQGPTFLHMSPPYRPSDAIAGTTDTDTNKQLFVTCFEAGEVYVVDPYVPQIISIIEVGRGPAGLAFSNESPPNWAYVVGFGANNVSVIDLRLDSSTRYHVIERIGFPSPTPR
jgi:hypothetical protein